MARSWIDPNDEVQCFDLTPSRVKAMLCHLRLDRVKVADCFLRLLAQRRGQCLDPGEEVLALLLPAKLDDFIVLGLEQRARSLGM